jgi:hypothetical protein
MNRVQRPGDVDAPLRDRQSAKLRGVRAKLVECHRAGDDGTRRDPDIGSRDREFRLIWIVEGFDGAADDALAAEEEHVLRCLGAAVIMQWNTLPTSLQREIFDTAGSVGEVLETALLRGQIARFRLCRGGTMREARSARNR